MARTGLLLVALVAAWSGPAVPADWSLSGNVSERLTLDTNPTLDPEDAGDLRFGSTTTGRLTLGMSTPRTRALLSTGLSATYYVGGDDDDNDDSLDGIRPNLNARVQHQGLRYTATGSARIDVRSTDFTELRDILAEDDEIDVPDAPTDVVVDTVRVDDETDEIFSSVSGSVSLRLSPRNTLSLGASASFVRFAESVPRVSSSDNFGASLSFSRTLSPISSTGLSLSALRFSSKQLESPEASDGYNLSLAANYGSRLAPDVPISGSLGVSWTTRTEDILLEPFGIILRSEEDTIGATGSLSLSFDYPDSRFRLSASQRVQPSSDGDVRNVSRIGIGYAHSLTPRLSLSLSGSYVAETEVGFEGDVRHLYSVGPTLSYDLGRNWSASLSYRLRGDNDEAGSAISNQLGLTVSRSLDFF